MSAFRCSRCAAEFAEPGFCPHDGTKLAEAPGPGTLDDLTPTVQSTQMQAQEPPGGFGSVPPSGMFRSPSGVENTADAIAAFHANAQARTEYDRLIGQTLDGRYRIERKLGEGGMGVVFAARHAVIERPLAIKVLKREVMRDGATIKRFVQEAKAASRIGHLNIIDVTDFGTTPDGMTYQVMEYVDGKTLGQAIKAGAPFKPSRSIRIAAQLARALGAAHDKGIVHRDLKPENIFLTDRDGRRDFVKIVDFGIAKVAPVDGQNPDGPRLTRAGAVFGTPEYMAPEQAAGRGDTDGRVDVYALGIILYEMTTGKVPHKGDTMVRTLAMQMLDPPIPPSTLRPDLDLPPEFEQVILHALTKKREQRYQTMGELLAALEGVAGASLSEPVSIAASVGPERAFTLAPLPPGADAARVRSARPSMPLLDQRSRRGSGPMPISSGSDSGAGVLGGRSRPGDSQPMPMSTGEGGRLSARVSAPLSVQPAAALAAATADGGRLPRRIKNEPQFVTGARPVVSLDHVVDDERASAPVARRWPWIALAVLFAGGLGVMMAVTLTRPRTEREVPVVVTTVVDARLAEPPPAPVDAQTIVEIPPEPPHTPDARRRDPSPRPDARPATSAVGVGTGSGASEPIGPRRPGVLPGERGAVRVLTHPENGNVYTDRTYRGPSGVLIQEAPGTHMRVQCRMPGYQDGELDVTLDRRRAQVLLCKNGPGPGFDHRRAAPVRRLRPWRRATTTRDPRVGSRAGAGRRTGNIARRRGVATAEAGSRSRGPVSSPTWNSRWRARALRPAASFIWRSSAMAIGVALARTKRVERGRRVAALAELGAEARALVRGAPPRGGGIGGTGSAAAAPGGSARARATPSTPTVRLGRHPPPTRSATARRPLLVARPRSVGAPGTEASRSVLPAIAGGGRRRRDLAVGDHLGRRLLGEHRHRDHADVARLALATGVGGIDRREPEGRHLLGRGAEALDAQVAARRHDVAALAEIAVLAVDRVEAVDGDHRLDAGVGRVGDPDGVALALGAEHVGPIAQPLGVDRAAVLAHDRDLVRRARGQARLGDQDELPRRHRQVSEALGVSRAAGADARAATRRGGDRGGGGR
ncbi:MAG: serine/threonine-protein kinase [Kofleriaceae bacterium]